MSKYTTQLRYICESVAGYDESQGYTNFETVIQAAIPKIFDFDFPVYDKNYRNVLCTKILKHFYLREIGFETYGQWKLYLNTRLNEIMPYYNTLYQHWHEDLFDNTDITTERTITHDDETRGNTAQTDIEKYSDTPQGSIQNIENDNYLTSANIKNTDTDNTQNFNSTEKYLENMTGKSGGDSYIEMLDKFKSKIINIDMMVLSALDDLFLQLW